MRHLMTETPIMATPLDCVKAQRDALARHLERAKSRLQDGDQ